MKKLVLILAMTAVFLIALTTVALGQIEGGAQSDQYVPVNPIISNAAAQAGITVDTLNRCFNAVLHGNPGACTPEELAALCEALRILYPYKDQIPYFDVVYNALNCSGSQQSVFYSYIPSTGLPLALLVGSGVIGSIAAVRLFRRSSRR